MSQLHKQLYVFIVSYNYNDYQYCQVMMLQSFYITIIVQAVKFVHTIYVGWHVYKFSVISDVYNCYDYPYCQVLCF